MSEPGSASTPGDASADDSGDAGIRSERPAAGVAIVRDLSKRSR